MQVWWRQFYVKPACHRGQARTHSLGVHQYGQLDCWWGLDGFLCLVFVASVTVRLIRTRTSSEEVWPSDWFLTAQEETHKDVQRRGRHPDLRTASRRRLAGFWRRAEGVRRPTPAEEEKRSVINWACSDELELRWPVPTQRCWRWSPGAHPEAAGTFSCCTQTEPEPSTRSRHVCLPIRFTIRHHGRRLMFPLVDAH